MGKELTKEKETAGALVLMGDMEADAGAGFENVTAEDKSIPYLSLAQNTSKKVKKGPEKIEGLEEGDFINTATNEIFKAGTFRVIPCKYQMRYVERESPEQDARILAVHTDKAVLDDCARDEKGRYITKDGSQITPAAMYFVLVLRADGSFIPAVVSLSSSQIRRSKNWLALMEGLKIKTASGLKTPPMFSHSYKVNSISTSNDQGSWMLWDFSGPEMLTDADLYRAAKAFNEEVSRGMVKVAEPPKDDAPTPAGSDHF